MENKQISIAFFSNFLNHHQVHVADELYNLSGGSYTFVELEPMPDSFRKSGYADYSQRPYLLQAWRDEIKKKQAYYLALNVDVFIKDTNAALPFLIQRLKFSDKISFEASERWFKKGVINILSPRFLKWYVSYIRYYRKKPIFKLCSSAYTSYDMNVVHAFKNRCYKWGYFTMVDDGFKVEAPNLGASTSEITPLMWCARFLRLKHPELPVQLAHRLKEKGYRFHIDMFGSGGELENTKALITKLGVDDYVSLRGNLPNEEILKEMRKHDIFLFTSDRHEGWGAVSNESMSNGCVLVGSDAIGSIPYLIQDGVNGLIFKSRSIDSLYTKVKYLLDNPQERQLMSKNGITTMRNVWSPACAARNLLTLIDDLLNGRDSSIKEGPCSKAEVLYEGIAD